MKIAYPAKITKDGDRYLVTFPDFAETATEGETLDEALLNAAEALTLTLEGRAEEGIEIPPPSRPQGKSLHRITPAARGQRTLLRRPGHSDQS